MNRTILVGRLTRDPDLRYTQTGTAVANFTLAVDRPFSKDKETDFINCVVWRKPAENLAQYMKKGSQIGVEGRIQTRTYEKDGKTVYITEVVADNIQFLESRNNSGKSNGSQQSGNTRKSKEQAYNDSIFGNDAQSIDIDDDELPF